jgi:hypothetical protein
MMTGAESQRRLDLDADAIGRSASTVVRAWTMKRPAVTGLSPARLCLTQSAASTRLICSAATAAVPAAARTAARTASSLSSSRK